MPKNYYKLHGHWRKRKEARTKWLEDNPGHLSMSKRQIVDRWKELGLIAPFTYWMDVTVPGHEWKDRQQMPIEPSKLKKSDVQARAEARMREAGELVDKISPKLSLLPYDEQRLVNQFIQDRRKYGINWRISNAQLEWLVDIDARLDVDFKL